MDLDVIFICQRLYKNISTFFVFRDIVLIGSDSRLDFSLGSAAGLQMVCGTKNVIKAKDASGKLYIVICEKICRNALQYNGMVKK